MIRALAFATLIAVTSAGMSRARAQEIDPWWGHDKALHFGVSAGITFGAYGVAALKTDHRPTRRAFAIVIGLGAGVSKEVWDVFGPGDASWRDLTWDVIGTATGVLVAAGIDWLVQRIFEPDPSPSVAGTP